MKMSHVIRAVTASAALTATGTLKADIPPDILLPPSANTEDLARALCEAIRSNPPAQAPAITGKVFCVLKDEDKPGAAAMIAAALRAADCTDVLAIVQAACAANPLLAPTVASIAAGMFPGLAVKICGAAAGVAPALAREIGDCVSEDQPDRRDQIFDTVRWAMQNPKKAVAKIKDLRSPENP